MVKQGEKRQCYKEDRVVRSQVYGLILVILIALTTLSVLFYYIKFKVEKVYIYNLDDDFTITESKIMVYNINTNSYTEVSFDNDDLGTLINISSIEFGFVKSSVSFTSSQSRISYLYPDNRTGSIAYYTNSRYYINRVFQFDDNEVTRDKFKMSSDFQMFYMAITLDGDIGDVEFDYTYYTFFNSTSTEIEGDAEMQISIKSLNFSIGLYENDYENELEYPYTIDFELAKKSFSKYTFDFTFR
jgi:hypothetical protein